MPASKIDSPLCAQIFIKASPSVMFSILFIILFFISISYYCYERSSHSNACAGGTIDHAGNRAGPALSVHEAFHRYGSQEKSHDERGSAQGAPRIHPMECFRS
ncbi:MAG: hypothetical protein ACQGQP_03265 [Desulfovibrio sp.]|jgi:hypothetical protein